RSSGDRGLNDRQQVIEHARACGDDEVVILRTRQLRARTRFRRYEGAGGAIPDLGVALEVAVDPRARHPAELERRRSEAPQVPGAREQAVGHLALEVSYLRAIRESRRHKRVRE